MRHGDILLIHRDDARGDREHRERVAHERRGARAACGGRVPSSDGRADRAERAGRGDEVAEALAEHAVVTPSGEEARSVLQHVIPTHLAVPHRRAQHAEQRVRECEPTLGTHAGVQWQPE